MHYILETWGDAEDPCEDRRFQGRRQELPGRVPGTMPLRKSGTLGTLGTLETLTTVTAERLKIYWKICLSCFFSALCSTCCCCCCFNPLDAASWLFVVQSRMEKEVWGTCLNQVKMPWRATTTRVLAFASRCLTCFRISCVCDMQSKNAWNYHNVSDSYIVTYYSKYYLYLYT